MSKEIQQFQFGILRILDCGFLVEEAIFPEPTMEIGYGMNLVYDAENNWIQIGVRADFKQTTSELLFLSGTVLTRFNVTNINGFEDKDGAIEFPPGSLEMLFGIAFSHMRAILAKNFAGSRFSSLIVPVINPAPLFKELFDINVQKFIEFTSALGVDVTGKKAIELFEINFSKNINPEKRQQMVDAMMDDMKNSPANTTESIEDQINQSKERLKKINKIAQKHKQENSKNESKQRP